MSNLVPCPSCTRALRVPDELLGRQVRCPSCQTTFQAEAAPSPDAPAVPKLTIDDAPPPRSQRPVMGAVEVPVPGQSPPAPPPPPPRSRSWDERRPQWSPRDEDGRERRPRYREAHRGGLVVALGVTGLVLVVVAPVGLVLSIIAWVMGHTDLKKIERGEMDASGLEATRAGWICGIIGTILCGLGSLCWGVWWMVVFAEWHREFDDFDF
jgi:predicted Zn finger-like uncharacterized protein